MSDEQRPPEDLTETRQVERDSQLSAMFDGELSAAECELLARRLTRDEALRAQWSRYSMIGAALRAEPGVALHDRVAWRVQAQVAQEASYGDGAGDTGVRPAAAVAEPAKSVRPYERWLRFARPVVGAGIAAGVAAVSILWLRNQEDPAPLMASNSLPDTVIVAPAPVAATMPANTAPATLSSPARSSSEPERYSTPAPSAQPGIAPPARLANYVVAHSEYSGALSRRMAVLGLMGSDEVGEPGAPADPAAPASTGTSNDAP
jgi:negative regulator of sigma E activity